MIRRVLGLTMALVAVILASPSAGAADRTDSANWEEGRKAGVYPLYPEYDWGALAVWGWGHGVVLDALDQLGVADMSKVVATGHSRGGKAALCAGIYDDRVAITAPNSSGTGGTGSLRYFEEGQPLTCLTSPRLWKNEWPHTIIQCPADCHPRKAT